MESSDWTGFGAAPSRERIRLQGTFSQQNHHGPAATFPPVQLAAAHELQINSEQPLTFTCFDRRLKQAASLLQMEVLS